jgi:hypothetical protein
VVRHIYALMTANVGVKDVLRDGLRALSALAKGRDPGPNVEQMGDIGVCSLVVQVKRSPPPPTNTTWRNLRMQPSIKMADLRVYNPMSRCA